MMNDDGLRRRQPIRPESTAVTAVLSGGGVVHLKEEILVGTLLMEASHSRKIHWVVLRCGLILITATRFCAAQIPSRRTYLAIRADS